MSSKVGVELVLEGAEKFNNGLKDAQKGLNGLGKSGGQAEKGTSGLNTGLVNLAAGMNIVSQALSYGKRAYDAIITSTVDYATEVRDMARYTGMSTEETSRLIQVADDAFVSFDTLKFATRTLAKDGIDLTTESLARMSEEYLALPAGTARTQYALEKFGRAGMEMTKILDMGASRIRAMSNESDRLGLTLSEDAVKGAQEFKETIDSFEDSLSGLGTTVGGIVIPVLTQFISSLEKVTGAAAEALNTLAHGGEKVEDALFKQMTDFAKTHTLEDFVDEVERLKSVAGSSGKNWGFGRTLADEFKIDPSVIDNMADTVWATKGLKSANLEVAITTKYMSDALYYASLSEEDLKRSSEQLIGVQQQLKNVQNDFTAGMSAWNKVGQESASVLGKYLWEGNKKYAEGLAAVDKATGSNLVQTYNYNKGLDELTRKFAYGSLSAEAYAEGIQKLGESKGLTPLEKLKADADAALTEINKGILALDQIPESLITYWYVVRQEVGSDQSFSSNPNNPPKNGNTSGYGTGGIEMAKGGMGMVNKPTNFVAGDAGPEFAMFIPKALMRQTAMASQMISQLAPPSFQQQVGGATYNNQRSMMEGATININSGFDKDAYLQYMRSL